MGETPTEADQEEEGAEAPGVELSGFAQGDHPNRGSAHPKQLPSSISMSGRA